MDSVSIPKHLGSGNGTPGGGQRSNKNWGRSGGASQTQKRLETFGNIFFGYVGTINFFPTKKNLRTMKMHLPITY